MTDFKKEDSKMHIGKELGLVIEDIGLDGKGIAHVQGLTVFISNAIPGDHVIARVDALKKNYAVASCIQIVKPSPDRIEPACPVAAACGGCTLQHLAYPSQLVFKQNRVREALRRIGHIKTEEEKIQPIIGMDNPWHYRNKVQFPISGTASSPLIGYYAQGSHVVIDSDVCLIQPKVCDLIRSVIREHIFKFQIEPYDERSHRGLLRHLAIRLGFSSGHVMAGLVINGSSFPGIDELADLLDQQIRLFHDPELPPLQLTGLYLNENRERGNRILTQNIKIVRGEGWIEEKINGLSYRISPLSFFQINPRQTEKLFQVIQNMAELKGTESVIDLYCGTGSIALQLARTARQVIGVESVQEAIEDAQQNALLNKISNVRFMTGKAEETLPELFDEGFQPDLVVVDPPRKGCDDRLLHAIAEKLPRRFIYVSCDPATLVRDVALLLPAGYEIKAIQPVDMFPWTSHVECVTLMSKVEK